MADDRLDDAYAQIDAANSADPQTITVDGVVTPYAVHYGMRMTAWLARLAPEAPDPLAIAARAQHIRRFDVPRATYPDGKPGYFAWRNALKDHHAGLTAAIMAKVGYDEAAISRMREIIRKERLKRDPAAQTLEDCACLVFLEQEFAAFAQKHDDAKLIEIVAKTWAKMSSAGHTAAVGLVPALPERLRHVVLTAVAPPEAR